MPADPQDSRLLDNKEFAARMRFRREGAPVVVDYAAAAKEKLSRDERSLSDMIEFRLEQSMGATDILAVLSELFTRAPLTTFLARIGIRSDPDGFTCTQEIRLAVRGAQIVLPQGQFIRSA